MKKLLLSALAAVMIIPAAQAADTTGQQTKPFTQAELPYASDALSSFVSGEIMDIHFNRHHKGYVDKLNGFDLPEGITLAELMKNISKYETGVRNNAGGHWNHSFFWQALTPDAEKNKMPEDLSKAITDQFGSIDAFKEEFEKSASGLFGSGWAWLIVDGNDKLAITTTPNQDNPLMDVAESKGTPILGLDVWEHAYYLQYQNKRADYVKNFWAAVNWDFVDQSYKAAMAE
jgi:superoxide dismutase, Fe-Mn family